jgi:hypothetical protein
VETSATGPEEAIRSAEVAVDRLADRLRSLSAVRLSRPLPGRSSRADAARDVAQTLADLAAELEADDRPVYRPVPRLTDFAVGDQVAVTGHDLVAAARAASAVLGTRSDGHGSVTLGGDEGSVGASTDAGADAVVAAALRARDVCRDLLAEL